MKEIQYKTFSLMTHKKNWQIKKPNVCQFELTFACGLHCKHCYTDGYNRAANIKQELNAQEVKFILDKVYQAGAIWLCFTGGDPLTRPDFLDIYAYAKHKGFIVTIFTNAYSMNKELVREIKNKPPFVIEMTLNAVTKKTYEKISQVKGSFAKVIEGINLILKAKLPLKIKTQITRDNLIEIPQIKNFIEGKGLKFRPSYNLHARLNGDLTPCNLRLSPKEILGLNGKNHSVDEECVAPNTSHVARSTSGVSRSASSINLFNCAIGGGDGIQIDPYGNTFACNLLRRPAFNLLEVDIGYAVNKLLTLVRNRRFVTDSKCDGCSLREVCHWCPGRAYVEKGYMEQPIEYYCRLAELIKRKSPTL